MFPLAGSALPTSAEEFARALSDGLRACGLDLCEVRTDGGSWPEVERLAISFSNVDAKHSMEGFLGWRVAAGGGAVADAIRLPVGHEQFVAGPTVEVFELQIAPRLFEKMLGQIHLEAKLCGAVTEFWRAADGALGLTLQSARGGELDAYVFLFDLERVAQRFLANLAEEQGVEVKSSRLEIAAPTPRTLDFRIVVTAKVFIMTATVNVRGSVVLDDQLNARFIGLTAEGEGMMAGMAESVLRPRLAKLEAKTFALGAFVAGGLRVQDVAVSVDDALRLHATLSGA